MIMKKRHISPAALTRHTRLVWACFLMVAFVFAGCGSSDPVGPDPDPDPGCPGGSTETTGTIAGTLTLAPGATGDLQNTRVAIYNDFADWNNDRVAVQTTAGGNGVYNMSPIVPGSYYMDAWKDVDNSGTFNSGDLAGVFQADAQGQPTPFQIAACNVATNNFRLFVIQ